MSLEDWLEHGWLKPHATSRQEIGALRRAADQDLQDARKNLSPGWRFAIAYSAALRLCSIALFASGYRAAREQKHYRTIAALPLVLGDEVAELADFLDRCRVKRHEVTYESLSAVSNEEADELVTAVLELRDRVDAWMRQEHPGLV